MILKRLPVFICIVLLLRCCGQSLAQEKDLRTAPQPGVRQITEWITLLDHNEAVRETHKRMSYYYRNNGLLDSIVGSDFQTHLSECQYFQNGKLSKVYSYSENDSIFIRYTYHNGREIEDIHLLGHNTINRRVNYFNEKEQVIEVKDFVKGGGQGDEFKLVYRKLLNYNDKDSLFAELHFHYMLYRPDQPSSQVKVVHEYDPTSHKRIRTTEYDFDGQIREEISYAYDVLGHLIRMDWVYPGKALQRNRTLQYQNGKIWQDSYDNGYNKSTKVYKDGRYIRKKEFAPTGKLAYYIDFQYDFY